jgi:hypothetical protein
MALVISEGELAVTAPFNLCGCLQWSHVSLVLCASALQARGCFKGPCVRGA